MKREEEEKKRKEAQDNPPGKVQARSGIARLIFVNLLFFAVVVGGLMFVSGHSLLDFTGLSFWAAKDDDTDASGF